MNSYFIVQAATKKKTLYVFYGEQHVGSLSIEANHHKQFAYDADWLNSNGVFSLSCSLPLMKSPQPFDVSYTRVFT